MLLLIKLLIAHLLGDFFLQPDAWIRDKAQKKFRSFWLYIHALIHGILAILIVWDLSFWRTALIIFFSHMLIDGLKMTFQSKINSTFLFLIDQLLHVLVITILFYYWTGISLFTQSILSDENILYLMAILIITTPSSILVEMVLSKWSPQKEANAKNSLAIAGVYIGILERIFVFVFILSGHWEGVGFLIAAKAFRFSEKGGSEGQTLNEYFLIGTMLSFGIAIFTSLLVLELKAYI